MSSNEKSPVTVPRHETPHIPLRPIGVVASETGLDASTLRVWERRYGFPKPVRRDSGHRFYSDTDVVLLQRIVRAIHAGYRPGQLLKGKPGELENLLSTLKVHEKEAATASTAISNDAAFEALLPLIRELDSERVRRELGLRAMAMGPKLFVTDFVARLLEWTGDLWEGGELSIYEEHFLTHHVQTILRAILAQRPDLPHAPRVLFTTLPGEGHSLGLKMAAVVVSYAGWTPKVFGPEMPVNEIARAAASARVRAVALSVSTQSATRGTSQRLKLLRDSLPSHVAIWVGGGGATLLRGLPKDVQRVKTLADLEHIALRSANSGGLRGDESDPKGEKG
jgi:methylmalonyl-CoA mutase cobalamin-binding subunit